MVITAVYRHVRQKNIHNNKNLIPKTSDQTYMLKVKIAKAINALHSRIQKHNYKRCRYGNAVFCLSNNQLINADQINND